MSEKKEIDYNATLDNVYADLKMTVMFYCGAWVLLWLGILMTNLGWNAFLRLLSFLMTVGAFFLAGGPLALKYFQTRSFAKMFVADYEVVTTTTYSDGTTRKSSDGGMQSMMGNTITAIIVAIIFLIIGFVVQLIRLIIQIIKYFYYYARANQKPAFKNSGLFLLLISVAVLIGTPLVVSIPVAIQDAAEEAGERAEARFLSQPFNGRICTIKVANTNLRAEPNGQSSIVKTLNSGDQVTITGEPHNNIWIPVTHDGTRGWVFGLYMTFNDRKGVAAWRAQVPFMARAAEPFTASSYAEGYVDIAEGSELYVYYIDQDQPYILFWNMPVQSSLTLSSEDFEKIEYIGPRPDDLFD